MHENSSGHVTTFKQYDQDLLASHHHVTCTQCISMLQNSLNKIREGNPEILRRYRRKKLEANKLLTCAIEIAELRVDLQTTFVLGHPWSAASWTEKY